MGRTRKAAQVVADFGHDDLGGLACDPRDGINQRHGGFVRLARLSNALIKMGDALLQVVNLAQQFHQQEPMVRLEPAFERIHQLVVLLGSTPANRDGWF